MTSIGTIAPLVLGLIGLVVLMSIFRSMWRVAEPNEALIISGAGGNKGEGLGFKIVTGGGTLVIPGLQTVRELSLNIREAQLMTDCVTHQGIRVIIKGVCIYKIGDDPTSIANAARRFLDQEDEVIDRNIQALFDGHLRSIIGGLTVEDLIREREKLTGATRLAASDEIQKLGLVIDSLQIQEIGDPTKYIENLALPHIADVQRAARIAQAQANQLATESEQIANANMAQAKRDTSIKTAELQAEIDAKQAEAAQAGPLADAKAQQQVIVEQTAIQKLEAARTEQELEVSVRRPADAKAYATKVSAQAERDAAISRAEAAAAATKLDADANAAATIATGNAEAEATKAKGLAQAEITKAGLVAEADGIKARAEALAQNQDAVVRQTLAELIPSIVEKAAAPFANIKNLNVLDGGEGLNKNVTGIIASAVGMLPMITDAFKSIHNNNMSNMARAAMEAAGVVNDIVKDKK